MTCVSCSVPERFVNPLFEVFDGGDFVFSSYRDIEEPQAHMRIYFERSEDTAAAKKALSDALEIVGCAASLEVSEVPDEDWKFAYRRHFKTELVAPHILVQPEWEQVAVIKFDPGMAFGTGKHETTKACLQYIDELSPSTMPSRSPSTSTFNLNLSLLDMGCGSGILSIAAAKLGFTDVAGFDVDEEAVTASIENAEKNGVTVAYRKFALGRQPVQKPEKAYDVVVANILGPLLIRFADEIVPYAKSKLIISGILTTLYPEVVKAYTDCGFTEVSHKTLGEWTTGLLTR